VLALFSFFCLLTVRSAVPRLHAAFRRAVEGSLLVPLNTSLQTTTVLAHLKNWSNGQYNFASHRAMLNMEISQMSHAPILVSRPLLLSELRSARELPHRKLRGQQVSTFEILIANRLLEPHVTHSKQTMASPSNREKIRLSALQLPAGRSHIRGPAQEKALAAVAANRNTCQIRNHRISLKNKDITISNRTKNPVSATDPFQNSPLARHSSRVSDFYRMRQEIPRRTR
jgi:hypothetical protein